MSIFRSLHLLNKFLLLTRKKIMWISFHLFTFAYAIETTIYSQIFFDLRLAKWSCEFKFVVCLLGIYRKFHNFFFIISIFSKKNSFFFKSTNLISICIMWHECEDTHSYTTQNTQKNGNKKCFNKKMKIKRGAGRKNWEQKKGNLFSIRRRIGHYTHRSLFKRNFKWNESLYI